MIYPSTHLYANIRINLQGRLRVIEMMKMGPCESWLTLYKQGVHVTCD
jgi:hypothetical protein